MREGELIIVIDRLSLIIVGAWLHAIARQFACKFTDSADRFKL